MNMECKSSSTALEGHEVASISEDNSLWLSLLRTFSGCQQSAMIKLQNHLHIGSGNTYKML